MPLPRFTLRTALLVFSGASLLALVLAQGLSAWAWAFGLALGAASIAATLIVHAAFYGLFVLTGRLLGVEEIVSRTSQGAMVRTAAGQTARTEAPARAEGEA
ncbi:MAG: hypothetical protein KF688_19020 [Pirellulales bacterium]|nr:hypothetical protein [Pirellulales bacterium]MBX3434101.1 hypothetical protein [Pirellulales bacterium]